MDLSWKRKMFFSEAPIGKAVRTMIFPTIISQIIMVIYNMADTWYVGLTGNAYAVAAVSLCLPVYSILSAVSNLFGIGGAGAMARALGVHDRKRAGKVVGMTLLGAMAGAVLYAWFMAAAARPLLLLIGGDDHTIAYAVSYTFWTIVVGGIPTILSPVCGHLIRAMGRPKAASFGMMLGAVLNILLDPLFMFVLLPSGHEVQGAAMATALSNGFAPGLFRSLSCCFPEKSGHSRALRGEQDREAGKRTHVFWRIPAADGRNSGGRDPGILYGSPGYGFQLCP